ncbi:hypothetical protein BWZ20_00495 [Winogradskyella sp. J14-2]|uniref:PD-(D/E)XK nuclease family protein n=1 Tax=Winogradskyella sp. J14-2 TaxID=1936080 RepID=UPI000972D805|nr:PD-(D/E)XK nuclease family protein [Winogradskyella sp. J14-2]APY06865.1 hypothetical protein BWZ20_00495 [Winogradskyella sp. J14-2]
MNIKRKNSPKSVLSEFDLLGNNETALTKAFAFVIGKERKALSEFLNFINIGTRITSSRFREIEIKIEYTRNEGRTDIEIEFGNEFHIIIEAKVRKNRIRQQRTQYLNSFNREAKTKILCFVTQERDSNKQIADDVEIINTSWLDITELYDHKKFIDNELVSKFLKFVSKNYRMNEQKEVLIQDLSIEEELVRYKKHSIYRRDQTYGTPLYFAPYFTRNANQEEGEGIAYLSKILGVLTLVPNEIENFETDLLRFKKDPIVVKNWIDGVKYKSENISENLTYYFLEEPVRLNSNLMKDGGKEKGRGKNWIAAMIPKNRCVTFNEFVKRMNNNVPQQRI